MKRVCRQRTARADFAADVLEPRRLLSAAVSFATHTEFTAGATTVAIATADFNADGNADLAVADSSTDTVNLFLGNGAGGFTPGVKLPLSSTPTSMAVGDFDGNGYPDIAVGGVSGGGTTVTVFLNGGSSEAGTFAAGQTTTLSSGATTSETTDIVAGDFNGDGHLDIAATDYAQGAVDILLGNGNGTFGAPTAVTIGSNPTSIVSADFNNDGHPDLAVADTVVNTVEGTTTMTSNAQAITFLQGSSTGTFTVEGSTDLSSTGADTLTAADLNNDGKIDLAYGSTDETAGTLVNQGGFNFDLGNSGTTDGSIAAVATGDFNLDGDTDVVFANGGTSTLTSAGATLTGVAEVTVGTGAGDGTFSTTMTQNTSTSPVGVVVGDFNNDGKPDVATVDSSGQVSLLLNTTAVTALKATTVTLASSVATITSGTTVTFTAAVATTGEGYDTGIPTGTVNFYDGSTLLGTGALSGSPAMTTFSTTTLSVGTHTIKATYLPAAGYAGSSATVTETVDASGSSGPDLTAAFVSSTLPDVIVPGEAGTVRVSVKNAGDESVTGTLTDALYLSDDGAIDAGATAVAGLKGTFARRAIRLAAGQSVTLTGQFTVPSTLAPGVYALVAEVNANGAIVEQSTTNNTAVATGGSTLMDAFGTVGGRRNVALTLPDAAGANVTYRLSGPGSGTVSTGEGATDLTLTGTTGASTLSIAGTGLTLQGLASSSLVGGVRTPGVSFDGALDFPAGVTRLAVGNLAGSTVTFGGGRTVASASFGTLTATKLTAAAGISALSVAGWTGGSASAAWVGSLSSKGAFGPNVTLTGSGAPAGVALRAANLAGGVAGGIWSVGGAVNSISLGTAGLAAGFSGSIAGTLRSLTDAGSFAGDLAAANFGSVLIRGNLSTADLLAGTGFGANGVAGGGDDTFAAGTITSLRVLGSVSDSLVAAGLSAPSDGTLSLVGDTLLGGGAIDALTVTGSVDATSKFLAASLPATVHVAGTAEAPSSDPTNFAL